MVLLKTDRRTPMPFINVKVAGPQLERSQTVALQKGITALMAEILHKKGPLTAVLVEQLPAAGWSIGGEPVIRAAQLDAYVSAGTNTAEEKTRFVAEAFALLRRVLGPELPEISYVLVHDVPMNSWGYGGLTQEYRAQQRT
jgi:4-oxalocrotonate tautomerase